MAEAVERNGGAITFLDNSDDFIQSHLDSHLPYSEEVNEEESDIEISKQELKRQSAADSKGFFNTFLSLDRRPRLSRRSPYRS